MHAHMHIAHIHTTHTHTHTHIHTLTHSPGSVLAGAVAYVLANAFFAYVDLTGQPAFLLKYKIQEDKDVPVSINHKTTHYLLNYCRKP